MSTAMMKRLAVLEAKTAKQANKATANEVNAFVEELRAA